MFRASLVTVSLLALAGSCGGDDEESSDSGGAAGGGGSGVTGGSGGTEAGSGGTVSTGGFGGAGAGTAAGGSSGERGDSSGTPSDAGAGGERGEAGAAGAAGDDLLPIPGAETMNCNPPEGEVPPLTFRGVARGFDRPLFVTYAPGDLERLFVVEQGGRIRVIFNGEALSEAFLDLSEEHVWSNTNEQGLLGLAFHPDYAANGRFFINYTAVGGLYGSAAGDTIVSEVTVSSDPNVADEMTERVLLQVAQPFTNHNGGMLAFGPDGYLYIGLGDGGPGGDPDGNGQNTNTLLGSILRIDIDGADAGNYGIPRGNLPGGAPEIWDYGLRNPWRFSFDACTGDLYIGDVGQNNWEELNVVRRGQGHNNFGWNIREGAHCFDANEWVMSRRLLITKAAVSLGV